MFLTRWRGLLRGVRAKSLPRSGRDRSPGKLGGLRGRRPSIEPLESRCLLTGGAIQLGPQTGYNDQPYVDVELSADGVGLGPYDSGWGIYPYNHMLLDTGSNGIMVVSDAAADLENNGLVSEGTYSELGVAGTTDFDLSNSCQLDFQGTDGITHTLPQTADGQRIMYSSALDLGGEPASIGGIPGIVGMPAMINRVTTLDMTQWSTTTDLFALEPMSVSFHDTVPAGNGHRYSVPVDTRLTFDPADGVTSGDGLPAWAPIPFLTATAEFNGVRKSGAFLLDTGSQMTLISTQMAFDLGLDENGNGSLLDEAYDIVTVGGVGGTRDAPLMLIDKLRIPTQQGPDLTWLDPSTGTLGFSVLVLDVAPGIDGVLGVDTFVSGLDFMFDETTWDIVLSGAPYFDRIHFDFRNLDNGSGMVYFDLHPTYDTITPEGDMVPPTVAGYSLANDSGASNSDQITNDNTPQLTFTFSEPIHGTDAGVNVAKGGVPVTPDAISWGTNTLTITFDPTALPDGDYTVTLSGAAITDDAGNPLDGNQPNGNEVRHFTIDAVAPPVPGAPDLQAGSDSGVSDTDSITNDTTPAFDLSGASPYFRFYRDGAKLSGDYESGSTYTAASQADGTYTYAVSAVDAAGNESALSPNLGVTIDTVAPAVPAAPDLQTASDSGFSDADNITNDNTPAFNIDVDGSPYFRFYRDGTKISGDYESGTTYTTTTQADQWLGYLYQVTACDVAGNESALSEALWVRIDTVALAPVWVEEGDIRPCVVPPDGPEWLTGVEPGAVVEYSIDGGVMWSAAFTAVDGPNTVWARQTDVAGNVSPPSLPHTFILDTLAPAAPGVALTTDTGISSTDKITSIGLLTLTGVETDAALEYSINGGTTWTSTFTPVEGSNTVLVRQTDVAGNIGPASAPFAFTLDTQGPTVTTYSLADDTGTSPTDQITSDTTPVLTFVFGEPVFGTAADVTVTKPSGGAVVPGGITGWGTNTLAIALAAPLSEEGQYTVTLNGAWIADTAGNKLSGGSNDVRHFTIDTTAPTADVIDVTPDPRTTSVSGIAIVFSDAVTGFDKADLRLTRNGVNVALTAATLTTGDNVTWTLGNLTGLTGTLVGATTTNYVLTLTAAGSGITDAAGNAIAANAADQWLVNPCSFTGSSGDDLFEFIAASPSANPLFHQMKVTLAGSPTVTYLYDAAGTIYLTVNAGLGNDTLKITGGPGTDTSNIYRYGINHTGPGYTVFSQLNTGSVENIVVDGGGGTGEKATLRNGPGSGDRFTGLSWQRTGSMVGTGTGNVYNNSVKNFDLIYGLANGGGTNATADLTDSYGNDLFVSKPEGAAGYSVMQHVGGDSRPSAYLLAGVGFSTIYGRSTRGGTDEAVLNGSSGDDTVLLQPQMRRAFLMKAGGGQTTYAVDFKKVTTYPLAGANDQAYLQGTTLDDVFTATAGMAQMSGTIPSMGVPYLNMAADGMGGQRWDKVYGQVNITGAIGGVDTAYLTGTTGDDTLIAVGKPRATVSGVVAGNAQLSGTGYWIQATGFPQVYADMKTGNDTANLYDSNGPGTDQFWGHLHDAVLSDGTLDFANGNLLAAASYYFRVTGFDSNMNDRVNLSGSATGGPNHKHVIPPLDYLLAVSGPWTDN